MIEITLNAGESIKINVLDGKGGIDVGVAASGKVTYVTAYTETGLGITSAENKLKLKAVEDDDSEQNPIQSATLHDTRTGKTVRIDLLRTPAGRYVVDYEIKAAHANTQQGTRTKVPQMLDVAKSLMKVYIDELEDQGYDQVYAVEPTEK